MWQVIVTSDMSQIAARPFVYKGIPENCDKWQITPNRCSYFDYFTSYYINIYYYIYLYSMGVFLRICHLSQVTKSSSPFVYKDCTSKMTCHKPRPPPHAYLQKTGPNLRETGSYLLKIDFYLHEIAELMYTRGRLTSPSAVELYLLASLRWQAAKPSAGVYLFISKCLIGKKTNYLLPVAYS